MKLIKINKNSQGFTLIELVIVLAILSGLAAAYGPQMVQQQLPISQADDAKHDIKELKRAANGYFMENRAWPSSVNELITTGYYTGSRVSPFGTDYVIGTNGDNLMVSIDTNRNQLANILAGKVTFGNVAADGETVSTEMGTPTREAIQSFFLARRAVAGCADCNQLAAGTTIDVNNNNLDNINEMDADSANITNAVISTANIDKIEAESVHLGNNSITYVGNQLNFNAGAVRINSDLFLNGDIVGNGNDITGFNRLEANTADFTSVSATTGDITSLSGNNLNYDSGTIDTLHGNVLNYGDGTITSLSGDTLSYNSGTVGSLNGNRLNYSSGNVNSLSGNSLTFGSGTINTLNGNTLTYTRVNGTNGHFNDLFSNSVNFGNVGVTGTATLNRFTANSGTVTNLTSDSANFSTVKFDSLEAVNLTASNANLATVNATNVDTNFLTTGSFSANSVNVTGNFSVGGTLTAGNVTVSNRITTNQLQASSSTLGSTTANSLSVTGDVTANSADLTTVSANSATITNLSGTSANFNRITANQFTGGSFKGTNFTTNQSSVNNNKSLIDQYIEKWNSCQSAGGCK